MFTLSLQVALATFLASGVLANPIAAPAPTPAPQLANAVALNKRQAGTACTFSGSNGYSLASVSKNACATIVLDSLTVPSGVTLNLEKLNDDSTVSDEFHIYDYDCYEENTAESGWKECVVVARSQE